MLKTERGQAGLLSVLMVVVLITMVVALSGFVRTISLRNVSSAQKGMALDAARAGVAYAAQMLSADYTTFNNSLDQQLVNPMSPYSTAIYPYSPSTSVPLNSPGASFNLFGNTAIDFSYLAGAGDGYRLVNETCVTGHYATSQASLDVGFTARALGIRLPTGLQVWPAVMLKKDPGAATSSLFVHGGPLVVFDQIHFAPGSEMDTLRYPRKFSTGSINGTVVRTGSTDNLEYWQNANLGDMPKIDFAFYQSNAAATTLNPAPPSPCPSSSGASANLVLTGPCILSDGSNPAGYVPAWAPSPGQTALFINSNGYETTLGRIRLTPMAVIVTGDLTLDHTVDAPAPIPTASDFGQIEVPTKAWEEYPFGVPASFGNKYLINVIPTSCWLATDSQYPCKLTTSNVVGYAYVPALLGDPNQTYHIDSTVFVGGNLHVKNGTWVIVGSLIVQGTLTIDPGAKLYVFYREGTSRRIHTAPLQVWTTFERQVASCPVKFVE